VALDKDSYIEKIQEMLNDSNTYSKINKNPIKKIEKTLNDSLKYWYEYISIMNISANLNFCD